MKNKNIYILFGIVFSLFLISSVSGFFPDSHQFIFDQSLKTPISSEFYKICVADKPHCFAGNLMSDSSVEFYYTTPSRYEVTHFPSFCKAMLDQATGPVENACAIGACTHQTMDPFSHDYLVDYAITHTGLPNSIIHPPAEQHLDNILNAQHPEIHAERVGNTAAFQDCVPLFKKVLSARDEYKGVNIDAMMSKFIQEISSTRTGYDPSFNNIKALPASVLLMYVGAMLLFLVLWVLLIFKRLRFKDRRTKINWFTFILLTLINAILIFMFIGNLGGKAFASYEFLIKPVSNLVPIGDYQANVQGAIDRTTNFFTNGFVAIKDTDATGFAALHKADASIRLYQWILGLVLVLITVVLVILNLRKSKNSYNNSVQY